ncbi:MAG: cytochrome P450 [Solirubrobacteraceae bacterium]
MPSAPSAPPPEGSPAGPLGPGESAAVSSLPPLVHGSKLHTSLKVTARQIEWVFRARREHGDSFRLKTLIHDEPVTMVSHPDHVKSLMTAKPDLAPSVTGESPLRPIVGPNSTLTALGARHMRQRKLLLPSFHGDAVARYEAMIADAAEREVDGWSPGDEVLLASRMQAITLDVIMAGIFGIEGRPERGTPEHDLRRAIRIIADLSTRAIGQVGELLNAGRDEPVGVTKLAMARLDKPVYAVIAARRADPAAAAERTDVLSLLLRATTEEGELLSDRELRDELLTLVLAGHETTANQLAWTFERLVRTPEAWARLRAEPEGAYADATIYEGQRSRPVIPVVGRRVTVPWRFGEHTVPAGMVSLMSILLLHHRDDLYPDPFAFRPERFEDTKPGTYAWIPFGGGIRRCLGAALAMAEMRIVLATIARRCELRAADPAPERAKHRNVTMIPADSARVVVVSRD